VKKICNERTPPDDCFDRDSFHQVIKVVETLLTGEEIPYSPALYKLALITNNDKIAQKSNNISDARIEDQDLLDANDNMLVFLDWFFTSYIGFMTVIAMVEPDQEETQVVKKGKKRIKITTVRPACGILKYDLTVEFEKQFKGKDHFMVYNNVQTRLGSYFIVKTWRIDDQLMKKSLENTMGFKVKCSDDSFNGYALLRAYTCLFIKHYTTYVLDRYVDIIV
jgi:hypothetical protein